MEAFLDVLSWFCFLTGGLAGLIGAIGLFRFPDFYTRLHAASITDTLGAGFIILGLMLQSGFGLMFFKLFLVMFIFAYTGPTAIHALAKTARAEGLEPELDKKGGRS